MSAASLFAPGTQQISTRWLPTTIPGLKATSPFVIQSADGTQNVTVSVDNAGAAKITPSGPTLQITQDVATGGSGGLVLAPASGLGIGGFSIKNGAEAALPVTYATYVASQDGQGLDKNDYELWAYTEGQEPVPILNANAAGSAVTFGAGIEGGCELNINGDLGLSRVYDESYNQPSRLVGETVTLGKPDISGGAVVNVLGVGGPGRVYDDTFYPLYQPLSAAVSLTDNNAPIVITGTLKPGIINMVTLGGGNADNAICKLVMPTNVGFYNIILINSSDRAQLQVDFYNPREGGAIITNATVYFTQSEATPSAICSFIPSGNTYKAVFARSGPETAPA